MIYKLTTSLSITKDIKASKYIIKQIEDLDEKIVLSEKKLDNMLKINTLSQGNALEITNLENIILNLDSNIYTLTNIEIKHILNTVLQSISANDSTLQINFK